MSDFMQLHYTIKQMTADIADRMRYADESVADLMEVCTQSANDEIALLQSRNDRIDECLHTIRIMIRMAENNITSTNIPAITVPPDYRVNMDRLMNWSMMIDQHNPDDPYAKRLYITAKCDETFLQATKERNNASIAAIQAKYDTAVVEHLETLRIYLSSCADVLDRMAAGMDDDEQGDDDDNSGGDIFTD
jgi:hypothetical protein